VSPVESAKTWNKKLAIGDEGRPPLVEKRQVLADDERVEGQRPMNDVLTA
jgi:hypothetical protein